jgi:glyoxylase-like metal-dependent hydrolase (beta-lactamase superfamily II)
VATQVMPGVWAAGTRYVNWYAVDAGTDGVTVVDAGLPGYRRNLDRELASMGLRRTDVRAVVLTHGHIDHAGMAAEWAASDVAVYLHPADTALAAAPKTNKTDSSMLPYLRWPATWAFIGHCLREGVLKPAPMPVTAALVHGEVAPVPGAPTVTHAPGHTDGSCVLEFRDHDVVFVGDLLCTLDPATGRRADPQLQTRASNRDSDEAMTSLDRLARIAARTVLPGHGTPWRDGIEAAVTSARRIGCR